MKAPITLIAAALASSACSKQETSPAPVPVGTTAAESVEAAPVQPSSGPVMPSFDCAKAESAAETLVCSDPGLAALDRRLAEVYTAELAKSGASDDLAAIQRGWVKERDDCWKADDKRQCVEQAYRTRIAYLQINSPDAMAATPVEFVCDDNSKPFTMAFYNALDGSPAVITLGNDQAIVFPQPAASGSKYGREGITFWEHQGKAAVDFFGIELECTPLPASAD